MKFIKSASAPLRHLWNGVEVFGGLVIWLVIVAVVSAIFSCVIGGLTAIAMLFLPHLLSGTTVLIVAKWTFGIVAVVCAIVTAYLDWISEDMERPEERLEGGFL
ncbi:MAG: hypothetical protein AAB391_01140 [Patescibacteria group bacterium]